MNKSCLSLVIASLLIIINFEVCLGLKIAAFNIQNFGAKKTSNSDVVGILALVYTDLYDVYVNEIFTWLYLCLFF